MQSEHLDLLIVGAGISGIGAGYYLNTMCPGKTWAILERRGALGGTWDLFRYPGIRSDSDMYTFGYQFKPWTNAKSISDGESIRNYVQETAREFGIDRKIRYGIKVLGANWSSADAMWTVEAQREGTGETLRFTCNFFLSCTGYYNYDQGYSPEFPGSAQFGGTIVHPQHWPENLDYAGKRVIIIGSGATAVTLLPAMAEQAAHVTMLQRSPTYVISVPEKDHLSNAMRRLLPEKLVYRLARMRNVGLHTLVYQMSRRQPGMVRGLLRAQLRRQLGKDYDLRHFSPKYNPWDERICAVPDGDMFKVLRSGKADVVTDQIATFTPKGIRLQSGKEIEADIIVTATGLNVQLLGGMTLQIDGKAYDVPKATAYKGLMFDGLPNMAMIFGYPNLSWTLKVDISCAYLGRLLNYMDKKGMRQCMPRLTDPSVKPMPFMVLQSGYVRRAGNLFPKQGSKAPWRLYNNYFLDLATLRFKPIDDGVLTFSREPLGARRRV